MGQLIKKKYNHGKAKRLRKHPNRRKMTVHCGAIGNEHMDALIWTERGRYILTGWANLNNGVITPVWRRV